jgi:hypothetical protein
VYFGISMHDSGVHAIIFRIYFHCVTFGSTIWPKVQDLPKVLLSSTGGL